MTEELGAKVKPFRTHDLRRTVRTRLAGLRIADAVAELVIGHGKKGTSARLRPAPIHRGDARGARAVGCQAAGHRDAAADNLVRLKKETAGPELPDKLPPSLNRAYDAGDPDETPIQRERRDRHNAHIELERERERKCRKAVEEALRSIPLKDGAESHIQGMVHAFEFTYYAVRKRQVESADVSDHTPARAVPSSMRMGMDRAFHILAPARLIMSGVTVKKWELGQRQRRWHQEQRHARRSLAAPSRATRLRASSTPARSGSPAAPSRKTLIGASSTSAPYGS